MKKKVLLLFPQGIGDMIYTIDQFILNLNFSKNEYDFTFLVQYKQNSDLLKYFIKDENLKIFYTPKKKIEYFKLLKLLIFKKYDYLIIDPNVNKFKACFFAALINSKIKIFTYFFFHQLFFNYVLKENNYSRHQKMYQLSQILNPSSSLRYNFKKFNLHNRFSKNQKETILGIAPGSGTLEKHKRWPIEHFVNLANKIISENKIDCIYIFGSVDENDLLTYLSDKIYLDKIRLFNKSIINSLEALINCDFLIANDNGMTHAAHCLKIKHITIIGPTEPNQFVDKSQNNFVSLNLPCSPCYDRQRLGCGNEKCLKELNTNLVFEKINEIKKKNNIF